MATARIFSRLTKKGSSASDTNNLMSSGLSFLRYMIASIGSLSLFSEWLLNEISSFGIDHRETELLRYITVSVGAIFLLGEVLLNERSPFSFNQREVEVPKRPNPPHYDRVKLLKQTWDSENKTQRITADTLLSRSDTLTEIYKDTHYGFIHAYASENISAVYLTDAVARQKEFFKYRFFKYIRISQLLSKNEIKKRVSEVQAGNKDKGDHDDSVRAIMISADADFTRKAPYESAQHFLRKNSSLRSFGQIAESILSDKKDIPHYAMADLLVCHYLWNQTNKAHCGNIFFILIPKEVLKKALNKDHIVYSSHPFGSKCDCHPGISDIDILEAIQQHKYLGSICNNLYNEGMPQFRLIIENLLAEEGVLVFNLTPFSKNARRDLKKQIKNSLEHDHVKSKPRGP